MGVADGSDSRSVGPTVPRKWKLAVVASSRLISGPPTAIELGDFRISDLYTTGEHIGRVILRKRDDRLIL
jgi:hypothetical protein